MSSCHCGKTQGWAMGVQTVEEAKKCPLLHQALGECLSPEVWPEDDHILEEHQRTALSSGKRPNSTNLKCPSGKKSRSCCQESRSQNSASGLSRFPLFILPLHWTLLLKRECRDGPRSSRKRLCGCTKAQRARNLQEMLKQVQKEEVDVFWASGCSIKLCGSMG